MGDDSEHKRRRRRRRLRRRMRHWGPIVGALVVLVAISCWLLYRDAMEARQALIHTHRAISAVRQALGQADVATARTEIDAASTAIGRAASRTSGPLWEVAGALPLAGRSIETIERVVEVGQVSVRTVDQVVRQSEGILDDEGNLQLSRDEDGALDLAQFEVVASFLDSLPRQELSSARDALAETPSTWVPDEVLQGRRDTLALADEALVTLDRAEAAMEALPTFLGRDGPRRYLLAFQNPGELRGTGGLSAFFAILTAEDGKLAMTQPQKYSAVADEQRTPVEVPEEFLRRYEHTNAHSYFSNVNVDPEFTMVAPVVLDLYQAQNGETLDGVVVIDPVGAGLILEAIGPVDVPDEFRDPSGRIPDPVPPQDVAQVTMVDAYDVFGGLDPRRNDFHTAFARATFELLLGGWDPVAVADRAGLATGRRHLQLFSSVPEEQQAFELLGVAGQMASGDERDMLAVTANNAAGNKMDVHVAHRVRGEIALAESDSDSGGFERTANLDVELENPLGTHEHDIYIVGSTPLGANKEGHFTGPKGLSRTWFTIWSRGDTRLIEAVDEHGEEAVFDSDLIHGHLAVDHYLEVPARSTRSFSASLEGPVSLRRDGADLVYDLTLWRQGKAIPDHWDLTITPPEGWSVESVEVAGGGDGEGMGVAGDGIPVAGSVEDGMVRVVGAATQDVDISVRLTRPLWDRFVDWLSQPAF